MNHLAHCFLSGRDEKILIGNFITDFITKSQEKLYTGRLAKGIELHRKIDSYSDEHSASVRLRDLIRKSHRKYTPVVVDLIWDHYLSIHWEKYSSESLRSFADRTYPLLLRNKVYFPPRLRTSINQMISSDFLLAYASHERMKRSLQMMDLRAAFPSNFTAAVDDIIKHDAEISALFEVFFADVKKRFIESFNA